MKWSSRISGILLTLVLSLGINLPIGAAVNESGRQSEQDVNSPDLRQKQGLIPGTALLFNGWGMTPAGESVPIADLALKLTITPDGKSLIAVHGGFNKHGVTLFDLASKKQTEFVPLAESWNGLAFGTDHKRFFISGGDSGKFIYSVMTRAGLSWNAAQTRVPPVQMFSSPELQSIPAPANCMSATKPIMRSGWSIPWTARWRKQSLWDFIRTVACLAQIIGICMSVTGAAAALASWTWGSPPHS